MIYFFLAVLGLHCCVGFSLAVESEGYSLVAVCRLLFTVTSFVAEHRLQGTGSVVVVYGVSCSVAYGIFPDQGLNLCLLHWQVDSYPLCPRKNPPFLFN